MKEADWAELISNRLNALFENASDKLPSLKSRCNAWLPYRFEIFDHDEHGFVGHPTQYKTDILVAEGVDQNKWRPRVVIETKLKISTHDALTYSAKAETHKQVFPYLRYGLLMGGAETSVPMRLFRHGAFFDFMVVWRATEPTRSELKKFCDLILDEIEVSRTLERLIGPKKSRTDKRYSMIRKKLLFED